MGWDGGVIPAVESWALPDVGRRLTDYLELTKPRIVAMVLVTTSVGFYLGSAGVPQMGLLLHALGGTMLAAAGTLALNQHLERDLDARMERTRRRPLPDGRLTAGEALAVGTILLGVGLGWLGVAVNGLTAGVTATIAVVYLGLYTPLKRWSALCSIVGAIPGALPPVAGWAAARGSLGVEPWILFAIMFLWQIPHSLAVAQLYRDDYERAGIRLLPVIDRDGPSTGMHVVSNCLALLPTALLPTLVGLAGPVYFLVSFVLSLGFLWMGIVLARTRALADARRLLFASLVYLPVLLTVMALDKLSW